MVIFVAIGVTINIYINALEPLYKAQSKAEEIALEKTDLAHVEEFSLYNGTDSFYVVRGTDESGEKLIAWIPAENSEKIIVKKEEDGITKDEAIEKLFDEKTPDEIMTVKLGVENNIPLWEIYYRSNNLINYYYIDFETGEWLKNIQNL